MKEKGSVVQEVIEKKESDLQLKMNSLRESFKDVPYSRNDLYVQMINNLDRLEKSVRLYLKHSEKAERMVNLRSS